MRSSSKPEIRLRILLSAFSFQVSRKAGVGTMCGGAVLPVCLETSRALQTESSSEKLVDALRLCRPGSLSELTLIYGLCTAAEMPDRARFSALFGSAIRLKRSKNLTPASFPSLWIGQARQAARIGF
ncbi:MAG: hypothetical protein RQ741_02055 [Wenzhouxiangellaceae bacterium]|nr:hypothetical protein [Wenzhouxiangellaceae bacterium]